MMSGYYLLIYSSIRLLIEYLQLVWFISGIKNGDSKIFIFESPQSKYYDLYKQKKQKIN